jgi:predicted dehydrogenase
VAVADPDSERLEHATAEYDVLRSYEDGSEMLEDGDLDLVSICTPPSVHRTLAITAAEQGISFLCEKPTALTIRDVEEILEAVERGQVVAAGGYSLQFASTFERALRQVHHGLIGPLRHIEVLYYGTQPSDPWKLQPEHGGGGVLMDLLPHVLSYCFRLLDQDITVDSAQVRRFAAPNVESDVRFDGAVGDTDLTVTSGWRSYGGATRFDLYGEDGVVTVGFDEVNTETYGSTLRYEKSGLPQFDVPDVITKYPQDGGESFGLTRVDAFIDAVTGDGTNRAPLQDSLHIMKAIEHIYSAVGITAPVTDK